MRMRRTNALLGSVTLSLWLAIVMRWVANRWIFRMHLHTRVVVLASVKQVVEELEEPLLREVEDIYCGIPAIGTDNRNLRSNWSFLNSDNAAGEASEERGGMGSPFHGSLRSMAYVPAVDLSRWLHLWRMGRYLCAALPEDLIVVERLGYIIKYVAFRRLSVMAEARYYAAAWRSAVYGGCENQKRMNPSRKPRVPPWLVGRRPFWVVPLSGAESGCFLCLPLSYFPLEAIVTCTAEETWIKELVDILPLMTGEVTLRFFLETLRTRSTLKVVHSITQRRFPYLWRRVWGEVDHLFFQYGVPLAKGQLEIREAACRRFYREKLFEGVEMVTGEGPDMDEGKDGMLYDSPLAAEVKVFGRDVLLRDATVSRRLSMLLRLRSLSHAVRIYVNLMAPQFNFFAEWLLFSSLSAASSDLLRKTILMQFSRRVIRGCLAAVVGAVIQSLDDVVKSKICSLLRDELAHELSVKLATADEAFLQRWEGNDRCVGVGGHVVNNALCYADNVASQTLSRFDYEQRRRLVILVVIFFGLLCGEFDLVMFAALTSSLNYRDVGSAIGRLLGINIENGLAYELARMEGEPLPAQPRYGLRLLLEILGEEQCEMAVCSCRPPKKSSWPCLSLIVCGGTFVLEWPVASVSSFDRGCGEMVNSYFTGLERLFDSVVDSGRNKGGWFRPFAKVLASWSAVGSGDSFLAGSLKKDAACVREFVLKEAMSRRHDAGADNKADGNSNASGGVSCRVGRTQMMSRRVRKLLHAEEMVLLFHHLDTMHRHVPHSLSFESVFSKHAYFVLRQLGLEAVFAYKAAAVLRQSEIRSIKDSLIDFVSSPFHNVFTQIFLQLAEFVERVVFYAFLSGRGKLPLMFRSFLCKFASVAVDNGIGGRLDSVSLLERMCGYRALLRGSFEDDSFGSPFRLTQQLSRYLPTTMHDASGIQYASFFKTRRQAWAASVNRADSLEFDEVGRITGGFFLSKGIEFGGIYFVYPQLHHHVDGSLMPALSNITVSFPAGEMTAVVGQTGSGKSTILSLLGRVYDPVVKVVVDEGSSETWRSSEGMIGIIRCCLDACLPPPPPASITNTNVILLDGIPVGCFSTAYLRSAVGMLGQFPSVFESLTFLENICHPSLSRGGHAPTRKQEEALTVARACRCDAFVGSRPLGYDAPVGALSAGEKQRLALAREMLRGFRGLGVLLLDEPTARLDGYNEACVQEAVGSHFLRSEGFTVIVVSHRLSALRLASRAVVLDGGRLEFHGALRKGVEGTSPFLRELFGAQDLRA